MGQQILVPTAGLTTPVFRENSTKRMVAFTFDSTYGDNQTREFLKSLGEAEKAIERVIGIKTNLFRPPFGEYNQTLLNVAAGLGYRTIMWTVDSLDWQNPGPDAIVNRVVSNVVNGAIILMHNAASDTPNVLQRIIDELRRRGFD